jgi:hypothetical protein
MSIFLGAGEVPLGWSLDDCPMKQNLGFRKRRRAFWSPNEWQCHLLHRPQRKRQTNLLPTALYIQEANELVAHSPLYTEANEIVAYSPLYTRSKRNCCLQPSIYKRPTNLLPTALYIQEANEIVAHSPLYTRGQRTCCPQPSIYKRPTNLLPRALYIQEANELVAHSPLYTKGQRTCCPQPSIYKRQTNLLPTALYIRANRRRYYPHAEEVPRFESDVES